MRPRRVDVHGKPALKRRQVPPGAPAEPSPSPPHAPAQAPPPPPRLLLRRRLGRSRRLLEQNHEDPPDAASQPVTCPMMLIHAAIKVMAQAIASISPMKRYPGLLRMRFIVPPEVDERSPLLLAPDRDPTGFGNRCARDRTGQGTAGRCRDLLGIGRASAEALIAPSDCDFFRSISLARRAWKQHCHRRDHDEGKTSKPKARSHHDRNLPPRLLR
jgi:hypothetical protein